MVFKFEGYFIFKFFFRKYFYCFRYFGLFNICQWFEFFVEDYVFEVIRIFVGNKNKELRNRLEVWID